MKDPILDKEPIDCPVCGGTDPYCDTCDGFGTVTDTREEYFWNKLDNAEKLPFARS